MFSAKFYCGNRCAKFNLCTRWCVMEKSSYQVFNQFIIMLSCYIISSGYHCISELLRRVIIYLWLLELDNFWCARTVPIMEFFFLKYLFLILLNFYLIILIIICSFCLQKFREKLPSYGKKEASISHANVLLSWITSSAKTSLLVFRFDLFIFLLLFAFLPHL